MDSPAIVGLKEELERSTSIMMNRGLAATAALALFAGAAHANTEFSYQVGQNWAFPLSPGNTVVNLPQFDDLGGTRVLKEVCVEWFASVGAAATAENDSTIAAPGFQLNLSGFVTVVGPEVNGFAGINEVRAQALAPSDGINGSGPDFHNFGLVTDDNGALVVTNNLAAFIGNGTVAYTINGSAGFSFSGTTDASLGITDLGASGFVEITYKYGVIPAPGAAALFGFAGLAVARRRR